jgi:hypothetical protein
MHMQVRKAGILADSVQQMDSLHVQELIERFEHAKDGAVPSGSGNTDVLQQVSSRIVCTSKLGACYSSVCVVTNNSFLSILTSGRKNWVDLGRCNCVFSYL